MRTAEAARAKLLHHDRIHPRADSLLAAMRVNQKYQAPKPALSRRSFVGHEALRARTIQQERVEPQNRGHSKEGGGHQGKEHEASHRGGGTGQAKGADIAVADQFHHRRNGRHAPQPVGQLRRQPGASLQEKVRAQTWLPPATARRHT